jgi:hypothetical protein
MGRIVAVGGVPHTPVFPARIADGGSQGLDIARRYAAIAEVLVRSDVDAVVLLTSDHVNAFFLDAWPTFAIFAGDSMTGPVDEVPTIGAHRLESAPELGRHLYRRLLESGFDPAVKLGGPVDHGVIVPVHLLKARHLPIVPIFVNGVIQPLPDARRCLRFGQALRIAVEEVPGRRIAVVASGSFSLEVGGPRIDPNLFYGVPDPDWAAEVVGHLRAGDVGRLVERATPDRMAAAGTVAGELLPWIVMAQLGHGLRPVIADHRRGEGHAFMAWE